MSLTGGLMDYFIIHHKQVLKDFMIVGIVILVFIMGPAVFCNGLYNWSIAYHHQYQADKGGGAAAANTSATALPPGATQGPTITPTPLQIITIGDDALKPNRPYPVTFSRDPGKDPEGAYFNMGLNFNGPAGPFPGVYIYPDQWEKAGGRVIMTDSMPTSPFYYSVFTPKGTSSSLRYDRQRNIVYTIDKDPEIMAP